MWDLVRRKLGLVVFLLASVPSLAGPGGMGLRMRAFDEALSTDLLLGGPAQRGQNPDSYLLPLYASELFALGGISAADQEGEQGSRNVSRKLTQVFVLKSLAAILDHEAALMKQSFEVPEARVEYAVRAISLARGRRDLSAFPVLTWSPSRDGFAGDAILEGMAKNFIAWPPVRLDAVLQTVFPADPVDHEKLRARVIKVLLPVQKYIVRQSVVNTVLLRDWRYRRLLDPLGPARFGFAPEELRRARGKTKSDSQASELIVSERVLRMMGEALETLIEKRYEVRVRTAPFSYATFDGLTISPEAAQPKRWLPLIFQADNARLIEIVFQMK